MNPRISVLFIYCILLCSCNDQVLSCDEEINSWAKQNVTLFEHAERVEIVSLPFSRQRAVFNGLSPMKKVELWLYKENLILESKTLSNSEKSAICELFDLLSPAICSNKEARRSFIEYAEVWETKMRELYGWDDRMLFYTVWTWMSQDEFFASVSSDEYIETKSQTDPKPIDCNCRYDVYCDGRVHGERCDKGILCEQVGGCGVLGTSSCNGVCK